MAILDAGPVQDWIKAFDEHERAKQRWEAANRMANQALINYLRTDMDRAAQALHAAIRALPS